MNGFDRACAVLAAILGVLLLILGVMGLFIGCNASFTLPPVLGLLPAFVGWGILRSFYVAWRVPPPAKPPTDPPPGPRGFPLD